MLTPNRLVLATAATQQLTPKVGLVALPTISADEYRDE